jgi:hypothetical protein
MKIQLIDNYRLTAAALKDYLQTQFPKSTINVKVGGAS